MLKLKFDHITFCFHITVMKHCSESKLYIAFEIINVDIKLFLKMSDYRNLQCPLWICIMNIQYTVDSRVEPRGTNRHIRTIETECFSAVQVKTISSSKKRNE